MNKAEIRLIEISDNAEIASCIRDVFKEHNIDRPGTAFFDPCLDHMFEHHQKEKSAYYVAFYEGKLVGGAGIFPTDELPADTCELVKMYLVKSARGKGVGKALMEQCIFTAQKNGFKKMYLETLPELNTAIGMYEKFGFKNLQNRLGNSGHHSCGIYMLKEI
jgi:putative acetyltransferase